MTATYTKLRDGSWGIRVDSPVAPGTTITVTKKSGETKTETVSHVLWSGQGVTLCSIAQSRHGHSHRHNSNGCTCDCDQCSHGCKCDRNCNCRGGNIYDC